MGGFERGVGWRKYFEGWDWEKDEGYVGYGDGLEGGERYWGGRMRKGEGEGVVGKEVGKLWGMLEELGKDWVVVGRVG